MKRLSKNATIVFRYLYQHANRGFLIAELYRRLGLIQGDEKDVVKELSALGLIQPVNDSGDPPSHRISEYGKRVFES